jgi:hypothetical protein
MTTHRRKASTARSGSTGASRRGIPAISGLREDDDDVQLEVSKMLAKRRPRNRPAAKR